MPRALRVISLAPTSASSSRSWRLSDGCAVRNRCLAATVMLFSSATATK
jgi:hypothetical protein